LRGVAELWGEAFSLLPKREELPQVEGVDWLEEFPHPERLGEDSLPEGERCGLELTGSLLEAPEDRLGAPQEEEDPEERPPPEKLERPPPKEPRPPPPPIPLPRSSMGVPSKKTLSARNQKRRCINRF
jgi:hypothetical protein